MSFFLHHLLSLFVNHVFSTFTICPTSSHFSPLPPPSVPRHLYLWLLNDLLPIRTIGLIQFILDTICSKCSSYHVTSLKSLQSFCLSLTKFRMAHKTLQVLGSLFPWSHFKLLFALFHLSWQRSLLWPGTAEVTPALELLLFTLLERSFLYFHNPLPYSFRSSWWDLAWHCI